MSHGARLSGRGAPGAAGAGSDAPLVERRGRVLGPWKTAMIPAALRRSIYYGRWWDNADRQRNSSLPVRGGFRLAAWGPGLLATDEGHGGLPRLPQSWLTERIN